ncbi:MAG: ATP-binding protein [Candidatus Solibacter sp.]
MRTDAVRLREVLINLIGNAIKFTAEGSITLRLDARPSRAGEKVLLRFEVEDTGIGIALEDQQRVFQPFEQVSIGSYRKGTGLGLSITRQMLDLMGGSIQLESTPGQGSCFRVELPVVLAQESEVKPEPARKRVLGLEAGQPEYRILVLDDEPQNSMVLERLLKDVGFQVRVAENGEQGVEGFRTWRAHFIGMDLRMPVMDGVEAVRRIRELESGRDAKISAVTASGFESKRSAVMAAGFDDCLRKPYRPVEISSVWRVTLGVRYSYEDAEPRLTAEPIAELRPDAIAALPAWLREELRDAVISLDVKRISRTVQKVSDHDAALGSVLARYAQGYAFTAMLAAVEGAGQKAFEQEPNR